MANAVQFTFASDRIARDVTARARRGLVAVGTEYANTVKRLMRDSPASGRQYGRHRASAPGEPPAPDTGDLVRSVQWRVVEQGRWATVVVGSRLRYALYLEYGAARGVRTRSGRNKGRLRAIRWVLFPRPAWGPAMAIVRPKVPRIMAKHMRAGR